MKTFIIVVIIIDIILYLISKDNKLTGMFGEHWTKQELAKLDQSKYLVINNVTLKTGGHTHQIDHVVVSEYGIFVIETKQINGYIKGNEYNKKWTVNKIYHIYNPILQNQGHVKSLKELLDLPESSFIPIVCITSNAKCNIKSKSHVIGVNDLNKLITSYNEKRIEHCGTIYSQILHFKITDRDTLKEHVKYAKQLKEESLNKCPLCGGNLVTREGKHGKFIGCSNYPRCKFTKKI